jgi:hypothetical protein
MALGRLVVYETVVVLYVLPSFAVAVQMLFPASVVSQKRGEVPASCANKVALVSHSRARHVVISSALGSRCQITPWTRVVNTAHGCSLHESSWLHESSCYLLRVLLGVWIGARI